jgi:hypothetical protein
MMAFFIATAIKTSNLTGKHLLIVVLSKMVYEKEML